MSLRARAEPEARCVAVDRLRHTLLIGLRLHESHAVGAPNKDTFSERMCEPDHKRDVRPKIEGRDVRPKIEGNCPLTLCNFIGNAVFKADEGRGIVGTCYADASTNDMIRKLRPILKTIRKGFPDAGGTSNTVYLLENVVSGLLHKACGSTATYKLAYRCMNYDELSLSGLTNEQRLEMFEDMFQEAKMTLKAAEWGVGPPVVACVLFNTTEKDEGGLFSYLMQRGTDFSVFYGNVLGAYNKSSDPGTKETIISDLKESSKRIYETLHKAADNGLFLSDLKAGNCVVIQGENSAVGSIERFHFIDYDTKFAATLCGSESKKLTVSCATLINTVLMLSHFHSGDMKTQTPLQDPPLLGLNDGEVDDATKLVLDEHRNALVGAMFDEPLKQLHNIMKGGSLEQSGLCNVLSSIKKSAVETMFKALTEADFTKEEREQYKKQHRISWPWSDLQPQTDDEKARFILAMAMYYATPERTYKSFKELQEAATKYYTPAAFRET